MPETLISRTTRFLLRRICRSLVRQSWLHKSRIIEYYRIMREAARAEFTEDNDPTLDAFLRECHEESAARGPSMTTEQECGRLLEHYTGMEPCYDLDDPFIHFGAGTKITLYAGPEVRLALHLDGAEIGRSKALNDQTLPFSIMGSLIKLVRERPGNQAIQGAFQHALDLVF